MPFSRALTLESALPAAVVRSRLRVRAASPGIVDLAAFRRRQVIGWRLSEAGDSCLFQPEYGEALDVAGKRLIGLVEPLGEGSRIRGRITVSPLTRILASVWMLAVSVATLVALGEGHEAPAKVLGISALMLGVAVVMMRYSLWSTSRIIESRLRRRLDVSGPRAAA